MPFAFYQLNCIKNPLLFFWPRASPSGLRKGFFLLLVLGNLTFHNAILHLVISYFLISYYAISYYCHLICCHFVLSSLFILPFDMMSFRIVISLTAIQYHVILCHVNTYPIKSHHFLTCHFWLYHIPSIISNQVIFNLGWYFLPCYLSFLIFRAAITARGQVTSLDVIFSHTLNFFICMTMIKSDFKCFRIRRYLIFLCFLDLPWWSSNANEGSLCHVDF